MNEVLIQRLEVAVKRLETINLQRPSIAPKPNLSNLPTQISTETPSSIRTYDDMIEEPLKNFLSLCSKIGGDVADASSKLRIIFDLHRNFIWQAAGQIEPTDLSVIGANLEPITELINSLISFAESKRNFASFNYLSSISNAVQGLGWLTVKSTPAPYIKEFFDASMYYINRVRTLNKENNVNLEWAKSLCELMNALQKYVRQVHTTGLVWNSSPGSVPLEAGSNIPKALLISTSKTGSGPPPPPPPPAADFFNDLKLSNENTNTDRLKLFADLNKGEAVTAGLRKVTSEMQTHKNPNLRTQNVVKSSATTSPVKKSQTAAPERPPKTELKDFKVWNVEYHKQNNNIIIEAEMKQAVYIYKCENSVVKIKGKVNSVTVDGCKKTSVVFDDLLAQIEVINSQSIEIQTLGTLPTISIQKTDGCQVYLSKKSLNAEIISSKSSEMNILVPVGEDGEFVEYSVPEQYKTVVGKNKLETTVSDIV